MSMNTYFFILPSRMKKKKTALIFYSVAYALVVYLDMQSWVWMRYTTQILYSLEVVRMEERTWLFDDGPLDVDTTTL